MIIHRIYKNGITNMGTYNMRWLAQQFKILETPKHGMLISPYSFEGALRLHDHTSAPQYIYEPMLKSKFGSYLQNREIQILE